MYFEATQTNATGAATNQASSPAYATASFSETNPGNFSVPGPVIAATQATLTDTPATITYLSSQSNVLIDFGYGGSMHPPANLPPAGTPFTCSLFEDSTFLSHGVGMVDGPAIACYAYGTIPGPGNRYTDSNYVYMSMPQQLDVGHVYTMIFSQGTPPPSASPVPVIRRSH